MGDTRKLDEVMRRADGVIAAADEMLARYEPIFTAERAVIEAAKACAGQDLYAQGQLRQRALSESWHHMCDAVEALIAAEREGD